MSEQKDERRATRALTQRYDMAALRAIQKIEGEFLVTLSNLYGVEEDDLPIQVDTLDLYNSDASVRRQRMVCVIV